MSNNPFLWLNAVSVLIYFAVLIVAFIIAIINWNRSPRAAAILLAGLTIILLSDITIGCYPFVLRTTNFRIFQSIGIIVYGLTSLATSCGIVLIVIAVFVDRKNKPAINNKIETLESFETITIGTSDNPYHVSQPMQN